MSRPTLTAEARTETGKGVSRRLRTIGRVPAVLYGQGRDPRAISVVPKEVIAILEGACGKNTALELQIDGEKGSFLALIKDLQVHPWKRTLKHVDFWAVSEDQMVTVAVPFQTEGDSPLEKLGGRLQIVRKSLYVRCATKDIPAAVTFDMSNLPESNLLMVSELDVPEGVELTFRNDFKVLHVKVPKTANEAAEDGEDAEEAEETAAEE